MTTTARELERLLQVCEAAILAGVTPDGIRRAVRRGHLRAAAVTGRGQLLYRRDDVLEYFRWRQQRRPNAA